MEPMNRSTTAAPRVSDGAHKSHYTCNNPRAWTGLVLATGMALLPPLCAGGEATTKVGGDYAFSLYAGRLTDGDWEDTLGSSGMIDAYLLDAALSRTFWRAPDNAYSFELEGNVAKHFGDQDHWELNLAVTGRWNRFPWNDRVATSIAFGVGPSFASEVPKEEIRLNGSSESTLVYWHLELTLGPPKENWAALLRLHHRSTGFGLMGDDGGSNAVTVGLRYYF
ncbi:MAG TPA: hypothetical protein PLW81_13315 [Thiobacillaceae bacterium]|nr:hypothetical protein [Thiobacillaceae bacterium]